MLIIDSKNLIGFDIIREMKWLLERGKHRNDELFNVGLCETHHRLYRYCSMEAVGCVRRYEVWTKAELITAVLEHIEEWINA